MKGHLYYTMLLVIFAVYMVSGWLYLFNDLPFPYELVFWLMQGACLGAICYLSFRHYRRKPKQNPIT